MEGQMIAIESLFRFVAVPAGLAALACAVGHWLRRMARQYQEAENEQTRQMEGQK
jgi:hypothetical protein